MALDTELSLFLCGAEGEVLLVSTNTFACLVVEQ